MWNDLVDVARWTPSPHNLQPWKVRAVSAVESQLLYDPARLLPEFHAAATGPFASHDVRLKRQYVHRRHAPRQP